MRLKRAGKGKINLLEKAGAKRKKKNDKRWFWPWGQERAWEPSICYGTSRRIVTSLISNPKGWLRKQDAGAAAVAAHWGEQPTGWGVLGCILEECSVHKDPLPFFLDGSPNPRHVCTMWQQPSQCPWPQFIEPWLAPDFSWTNQILLPCYSELGLKDKHFVFLCTWNRKMWTQEPLG